MKSKIHRWFPLMIWCGLVVGIIIAGDLGRIRAFLKWVNSFPLGDKAGHVFLIGTLAFLLNYALEWRILRIARWRIPVAPAIVAALMTCEEFSQIWIPSRTFDLADLAANYTGCVLAGLLGIWLQRRGENPPQAGERKAL